MYICPLCEMKYEQAPEQCKQCKRPLILNKRFRIEISIQSGPYGEDFDVVDMKTDEPAILRELRIKRRDAEAQRASIERYKDNSARLGGMKYEGNKVLLDAFEVETKNSVCYYFAFDADAWAGLGDDLYIGTSGGDVGGADEDLPPIEGRDLDPELAAMLSKLESGGDDAKKGKAKDDGGGALVKTDDAVPASKRGETTAVAKRAKMVIAGGIAVIIVSLILAVFFFL